MRTVSFLGCTLAASPGFGGTGAFGVLSDIANFLRANLVSHCMSVNGFIGKRPVCSRALPAPCLGFTAAESSPSGGNVLEIRPLAVRPVTLSGQP
jgi:hypothetical protein